MSNLHFYYDQLTEDEQTVVDDLIDEVMRSAKKQWGIRLAGDDRSERAADAVARWIIESRS